MTHSLLIASKNTDKVKEMQQLLADTPYRILSETDVGELPEVEENADSYEANATLKAIAYNKFTGLPCIADDSGLEVDALNGAPGIYSARWSGVEGEGRYAANNQKLLLELQNIEADKRTAQFICTIVMAHLQKVFISVTGICRGKIVFSPRGERGFGYDPLFEVPEYGKTFAELGEVKNSISHRALALSRFKEVFIAEAKSFGIT